MKKALLFVIGNIDRISCSQKVEGEKLQSISCRRQMASRIFDSNSFGFEENCDRKFKVLWSWEMVKIKKCVYKLLTVVLTLLVVLNTSAIGVQAESVNPNEVTPTENDYDFSGGTITGLKKEYLARLSEEQKQNIKLVIPEKIGNVPVTSIGEKAFSQYFEKEIRIIYLDLSQLTELKEIRQYAFYSNASMSGTIQLSEKLMTIGSQAFEGCSSLTGDLTLPDSLTTMGGNAFNGCKGLTGKLTLSENMTVIPNYAFKDCYFTGNLKIPGCVTKIADSAFRMSDKRNYFQGKIVIPKSVTVIEKYAFLNQNGLTKVEFPDCNVESIGEAAFKGTGLSGVWTVPEKIGTIAKNAFYDTNLETIYLPSKTTSINKEAFNKCSKLNAIVCEKDNYNTFYGLLDSSVKEKLGYPIMVNFDDGNGGLYEAKECLYNLPYNYEKDSTGVWAPNNNYKFPSVINNESKVWAIEKTSVVSVKEIENVKGDTLYAINKLEDPVITYSEGIDKVYDGNPSNLIVTVEHPLYKKSGDAKNGDVVVWFDWYWGTIGYSASVLSGYDKKEYKFVNVREPRCGITCGVKIRAFVVDSEGHVHEFYKETHDFPVFLRQAESTVNPNVTSGVYKMSQGQTNLPEIKLSIGDTPGTITWDSGQTLKEGFGIYTWTFTPEPNGVDSNTTSNFKVTKGQVELYATTKDVDTKSLENKIEDIPEISEERPVTEEEKDKILDAYFAYESSDANIKGKVSEEKQEKIYDAISKLPQVETAAEGLQLVNEKDLLKNMTSKDAAAIKDQETAKCKIKVISNEEIPSEQINEAIKQAAGSEAKVGGHFDVQVVKTIESGSSPATEILTTVKKPLKLVFNIPKALQSANRKFFIIRAHEDAEGKITAEKLLDEDNDPSTITVTSDKFSTYAIAYAEEESSGGSSPGGSSYVYNISAFAGDHGVITPSGTAYAYYGSTKTFSFTPDEGYKVADVVVDGASVGAVSSYTFENITKAHTIAVTFEPIADDQDRIINGIKATTIKASSSARKGSITVKWKKSTGFKVDYFQVFRSTKKNSGYGNKAFYTTKTGTQKSYKNTKKLRKGTRYYYKVRGVRTIDGVKVCTKWSNKAIRIAK